MANTASAEADGSSLAGPTGLVRENVFHDERFRRLIRERRLVSWSLTSAMLLLYFGFILTIAFRPGWLGTPIVSGRSTTWGIPVCFGILVFSFFVVGIYVIRANTVTDANLAVEMSGGQS